MPIGDTTTTIVRGIRAVRSGRTGAWITAVRRDRRRVPVRHRGLSIGRARGRPPTIMVGRHCTWVALERLSRRRRLHIGMMSVSPTSPAGPLRRQRGRNRVQFLRRRRRTRSTHIPRTRHRVRVAPPRRRHMRSIRGLRQRRRTRIVPTQPVGEGRCAYNTTRSGLELSYMKNCSEVILSFFTS